MKEVVWRRAPFEWRQDEAAVEVAVGAGLARQEEVELFVGAHELRVLCAPWALLLRFAQPVLPDLASHSFCALSARLRLRLPKATPGLLYDPPREERMLHMHSEQEEQQEQEEHQQQRYYGFNSQYSDVFRGLEEYDVLELPDPERTAPQERRLLRLVAEET
jgi:hypothetical protein